MVETKSEDEAIRYRRMEREWQNSIGYALLDKPYDQPGSAVVFECWCDRLISELEAQPYGVLIEIGCGKGHFLERVRSASAAAPRMLVGLDLSRAVHSLPEKGLVGVQADGERLPFRDASATSVVFDGALHHCIDYAGALREAVRVLAPGGLLVLFEPVSSRFSQLMHKLLDPIVERAGEYESPIDVHYKSAFRQETVRRVLEEQGLELRESRSDFLAYPFTGCYAGSIFARNARVMRWLLAAEEWLARVPLLREFGALLAWRFTIVAVKPAARGAGEP
jgi:ubiquinone/menaquinone biosynthesis C-methylase UbiE